MIKTIVLDFDGVIVESVDIKTEAFKELYKEYDDKLDDIINYHLDNNAISRFIKFKHISENILNEKYDDKTKEKLGKLFSKIVFDKIVECPYVKGAEEFLKYFSKNYPIYLASNTPQKELELITKKRSLTKYFKGIYGSPPGDKVGFIKKIQDAENISSKEILYVGDMINDYKIAKKTNVKFVGRKNIESFDNLNVPYFSDLIGIKEWIKNQEKDNKQLICL